MSDNVKEKYKQEMVMLEKLYPKFQQLVNEFGLDYHGTPVHAQMENFLQFMRERNQNLKERLE